MRLLIFSNLTNLGGAVLSFQFKEFEIERGALTIHVFAGLREMQLKFSDGQQIFILKVSLYRMQPNP